MARTVAHWLRTSGENDWNVGANWDIGRVPTLADNAHFSGTTAYQVDVTSADAANILNFDDASAVLNETASGSMTTNEAEFNSGTVILRATNNFMKVEIADATVELNGDNEFGTSEVYMAGGTGGGTIEAVTDSSIGTNLHVNNGRLEATHGHTLTLSGTYDQPAFTTHLAFGSLDGTMDGTVLFAPTQTTSESMFTFEIDSGTVALAPGVPFGTQVLFQDSDLKLFGGQLDVGNFVDDTGLYYFYDLTDGGAGHRGSLINTSASTRIVAMDGWNFSGNIANTIHLISEETNTLGGSYNSLKIAMSTRYSTDLDISAATGGIQMTTSAGADAVVHVGTAASQVDRFAGFQLGNMTIDTTLAADIKTSWVDNDGVERLVFHPGHGAPAYSMYFDGITGHTGFVLGDDGTGHLQITYAVPGEHGAAIADAAAAAAFVPPPHDGM